MKKVLSLAVVITVGLMFAAGPAFAQHAAVGSEKCGKMCHKVQFESWAKSKHATSATKAECETCHGNGADYMKMSVMKDPAKAKEAGLIAKPGKESCTAKCHKAAEITADSFAKVHAHKAK